MAMKSEQKILTVQVYWNYQWHDAGSVRFPDPKTGLTGGMMFTYNGTYVNEVTSAKEGLSFRDERAIGHHVPGHLMKVYPREPVAPVLRDIIPQGAGRRYLLRHWDVTRDPGPYVDFKLLSEGCIAPIGNLRIKEAAEAFGAQIKKTKVISFTKDDISDRDQYLLEYANQLGVVIGSATGAGGDAPKLLVVEARDGGFYLEGTLREPEIANHWLVKFPRGRMTPEDQDVLRAESVFYRALDQLGQNTIRGAHVVEGKVPALWLPRFDREVTPDGIRRYGVESMYSLNQMIGDGARMTHSDVLTRLRESVTHPPEFDETLCEYLVRDVINYTIGNSDNHGRNTALIKRVGRISLSPAYDLAPMVLDREAIARTTVWPQDYQHTVYEPNYGKIIQDFAKDPKTTRGRFIAELEKLAGLRKKVVDLGIPGRVLEHKSIVFERPERFLKTLKNETGGNDAQNATKV
jgi:serine/threonine-protein kinase HipA